MYKYQTKTYGLINGVLVCISTGTVLSAKPLLEVTPSPNVVRDNLHLAGGLYTVVKGTEGTRIIFPCNL